MKSRIVIFYGCTPKTIAKKQGDAVKAIFKKLNIELYEAQSFSCCGGSHIEDIDGELSLLINARNLAYAENLGNILLTTCNTCYFILSKTLHLLADKKILSKINKKLLLSGSPIFKGKLKIQHILNFLCEDKCFNRIKEKIKKSDFKKNIMPFYGCHIARPSKYFEDDPKGNIEKLLSICGFNTINQDEEFSCCGFHNQIIEQEISEQLCSKIAKEAAVKNCSTIATCCPLCNQSLKLYGKKIEVISFEEILNKYLI